MTSVNISREDIRVSALTGNLVEDKTIETVSLFVQWICYTVICQAIDVFGICGNIINIIVFYKQGFTDTVNISLMGLAVSDIGSVFTLVLINVFFSPPFLSLNLSFDAYDVIYLTNIIPHTVFTRITCWITALITLERCLCIAAPLKVKTILTSKRTTIIIILLFIIFTSTAAPVYAANKLDMKFFPERNRTLLGLVYLQNRDSIESVSFVVNNATLPFTSFVIIVVCTATLVYKLRESTKWKMQSTTCHSERNRKVTKMVIVMSMLFIACFIPESLVFITFLIEPDLFIGRKYVHYTIIFSGFGIILESINSSMNIFIYYSMSSKYRTVFKQIFQLKKCF